MVVYMSRKQVGRDSVEEYVVKPAACSFRSHMCPNMLEPPLPQSKQ